jgi:hypothetical protein
LSKDDKITKTLLPLALEKLKSVKEKETDEISAIAAIKTLRRQIERLLRLDYSYEEISQMLSGVEVKISSERLKSLHREVKRQSRKKNKKTINSQDPESQVNSAEQNTPTNNKQSKQSSEKGDKKKTPSLPQEAAENLKTNKHNFQPNLIEDDDL